jgi:FkbM family methyltransferase
MRIFAMARGVAREIAWGKVDDLRFRQVTADVGVHCGVYPRKLARLSSKVHTFEPAHRMADLRRTSTSNVSVHEIALSDQTGNAELLVPQGDQELVYGLASLEPKVGPSNDKVASINVPTVRLDAIVHHDVAFVKIDVEGHELNGAVELLEHSQPVVSGRSGRSPPHRGDPIDLRILREQALSRLLPETGQRSSGRPAPFQGVAGCHCSPAGRWPQKWSALRQ